MAAEPKTNGNDSFKLPGSSLDEVFKVVQGYTTFGKPASLSDISKTTGMHETNISRNVGFLLSLGVLQGGRDKSVTDAGKKLGLALMHNVLEEVEASLADIVAGNEFLKSVLAAVRIRKGMDESSLRAHIAYSAGLSKTGSTTAGTGAVVELLKRSGNLKPEDGKLVVSMPIARPTGVETGTSQDRIEPVTTQTVARTTETVSPFSISIKIDVQCKIEDLDDLGIKLRKMIDDFTEKNGINTGED